MSPLNKKAGCGGFLLGFIIFYFLVGVFFQFFFLQLSSGDTKHFSEWSKKRYYPIMIRWPEWILNSIKNYEEWKTSFEYEKNQETKPNTSVQTLSENPNVSYEVRNLTIECPACGGKGKNYELCECCGGSGKLVSYQCFCGGFGSWAVLRENESPPSCQACGKTMRCTGTQLCNRCGGHGKTGYCFTCRGTGKIIKKEYIKRKQ